MTLTQSRALDVSGDPQARERAGSIPTAPRDTQTAQVAVVGTGSVGLTTGSCFAALGHNVVCADIDIAKIEILQRGLIPIHEDGLESIVHENISANRLRFVLGAENAVAGCEFIYLCLPTPQAEDGRADLRYLLSAAKEIGPHLEPGAIVVNKSTVPVGSTVLVQEALGRSDVHVVSNPEFLREGSAVGDFLHPDRVVIGADNRDAAARVASLYMGVRAPIIITDPASAETCKYAANAFLASKISFANAIAAVCEGAGADVSDVLMGIGYDSRIGHDFLNPGPGWGGSCFPKDTKAMIAIADDAGYDFALLKGVVEVNTQQFGRVVKKIRVAAGGSLQGIRVGLLGLTFKAGTDDMRDSPAIEVARQLLDEGAVVQAFDPVGKDCPLPKIEVCDDAYAAAEAADVVAVLTEWPEFTHLDLDRLAGVVRRRAIVDARNLLDSQAVRRHGFTYAGIGQS